MNPFQVVADFEHALAEYTGAPEAVTVDSCTNALFLSLLWCAEYPAMTYRYGTMVSLPRRTYVGVAQAVLNAGYRLMWREEDWIGVYQLWPLPVWDAAKRFRAGMYEPGSLTCVSFQAYKILPIGRGGAILTDSTEAAQWLRRARWDGRDPDNEDTGQRGWHMYLTPPDAARGLWLLSQLPKDNPDQPNEHVDISGYKAFHS